MDQFFSQSRIERSLRGNKSLFEAQQCVVIVQSRLADDHILYDYHVEQLMLSEILLPKLFACERSSTPVSAYCSRDIIFQSSLYPGRRCEDRKSARLNSSHGYISYA